MLYGKMFEMKEYIGIIFVPEYLKFENVEMDYVTYEMETRMKEEKTNLTELEGYSKDQYEKVKQIMMEYDDTTLETLFELAEKFKKLNIETKKITTKKVFEVSDVVIVYAWLPDKIYEFVLYV